MAEEQSRTGGVDFNADRVNVGGDVVGHDKIVVSGDYVGRDQIITHIDTFVERALTAAEEARQAQLIEAEYLAQGVSAFAQRLRDRVSDPIDADKGGPYKGLLEYRLSDAEIFFGRIRAIRELLEHLQRGPLTVLHAESGAGKTSLIQAGISPRLIAAGHLPIYLRPYDAPPSLALKRALLPKLGDTPKLAQASLRDFLSRVAGVLGSSVTLYIFLDQFEEFFVQLDEQSQPQFVRELVECLEDESLNVRWVLALRSEFFGNLATFRPRIRNPFENDYRLSRLTRDEAREAVSGPAVRSGITYEDGLISTILDDLGKNEVAPPQVQLVCSTLYESRSPDQIVITHELYKAQGGAAGILRGHLGRVLNRDLPAEQRPPAQRLLEALITSDLRRAIRTRAELASEVALQGVKSETLDAILSQLVDSRLLRIEEIGGGVAYELAHDYLLDEIKLDPAVQARKAAQELLEQEVRAYERHGTLLSDDKLAIIAPRRSELILSDQARELIRRSEQALRRRQRFVLGGIGLVIALVIIGALSIIRAESANRQREFAIGTQRAAEISATGIAILQATSESKVSSASTQEAVARSGQATSEADAAIAGTREAVARNRQATSEAGAAIASTREAIARATLRRAFESTGIVPVGRSPVALAFDGTWLWVAYYDDNTVQAIDPTTGDVGRLVTVGRSPDTLAFDGARLWVVNSGDDTVQAIDPATGDVGAPISVGGLPQALAFDGTRLWVANSLDGTVQAIDTITGDVGEPITVGNQPISAESEPITIGSDPIALAFDGARLWVANRGDQTVQAIDPTTGDVGETIIVGRGGDALAFDGTQLWVANSLDGTVQTIDPTTGDVGETIIVGRGPDALAFDGARLWVANDDDNTVQAIDPTTGDVGQPITVGSGPRALPFLHRALAIDGTRLWVANYDDNTVQAINLTSGDVSRPIPVGDGPGALTFDGMQVWVANSLDDTVQAIDPATRHVGQPITVGYLPDALAFDGARLWVANNYTVQAIDSTTRHVGRPILVGSGPRPLRYFLSRALPFGGTRLWVANYDYDGNTVYAIDLTTGDVQPITVGGCPVALAFDDKQLWVANACEGTVQAIDPATGDVGQPIAVGISPVALAFDGKRLWVANSGDNTVQAIHPTTGDVGWPITVGLSPVALAFDGTRLWVANEGDDTVQSIDPPTGDAGRPIKVGHSPAALVFDGTRLWVANSDDDTVQYIRVYNKDK